MTLRLHWSPDSANIIIRIALEMLGLPYEAVRIDRAAGGHHSAAYRKLNPQGLIPVLEDGEIVLFETGAILWHLADRTGKLGPDGPAMADAPARAASLKWLFYLSNTAHADLRLAFYAPRYVEGKAAVAALRQRVARRMVAHFDLLEAALEQRAGLGPILLTDIYAAILARWAQLYPSGQPICAETLDRWPAFAAMAGRLEAEPGAIRAFAAEHIPTAAALTAPRPPDLPASQITGVQAP